jgi:hypothetical protein
MASNFLPVAKHPPLVQVCALLSLMVENRRPHDSVHGNSVGLEGWDCRWIIVMREGGLPVLSREKWLALDTSVSSYGVGESLPLFRDMQGVEGVDSLMWVLEIQGNAPHCHLSRTPAFGT